MEQREWQQLLAWLERCPAAVLLDTAEPLRWFRSRFGHWEYTQTLVERVVEAVVDYATDPLLRRQPWTFLEYVTDAYGDLGGHSSPMPLPVFTRDVQVLALDIFGRMQLLGLQHGKYFYYRFDGLFDPDTVALRKVVLNELEEMHV